MGNQEVVVVQAHRQKPQLRPLSVCLLCRSRRACQLLHSHSKYLLSSLTPGLARRLQYFRLFLTAADILRAGWASHLGNELSQHFPNFPCKGTTGKRTH